MTTKTNGSKPLAQVFAAIASAEGILDTKADAVLAIVKRTGLNDLELFNAAVREAYAANGWQAGAGRARKDSATLEKVPATVKQYVSRVRAGLRMGVDLAKVKTFGQLRAALKKATAAERARRSPPDPRLEGITATRNGGLTGAPFHDLVAVYSALPIGKKNALVAAVMRIVRQFEPGVPHLTLVAAAA